jgi:hypothetical protein
MAYHWSFIKTSGERESSRIERPHVPAKIALSVRPDFVSISDLDHYPAISRIGVKFWTDYHAPDRNSEKWISNDPPENQRRCKAFWEAYTWGTSF